MLYSQVVEDGRVLVFHIFVTNLNNAQYHNIFNSIIFNSAQKSNDIFKFSSLFKTLLTYFADVKLFDKCRVPEVVLILFRRHVVGCHDVLLEHELFRVLLAFNEKKIKVMLFVLIVIKVYL